MKLKIVNCTECTLGLTYEPRLRRRNLALQEEYAPKDGVKVVILAESPPIRGGYIYDKLTPCNPKKFCYQVFVDLNCLGFEGPASEDDKEMMLRRMEHLNKALVLDCCNCAANHLRGDMQDEEREDLVRACFSRFAADALDRICKNSNPQIWFKFPPGRGKDLWQASKAKYGSKIVHKVYWSILPKSSDPVYLDE